MRRFVLLAVLALAAAVALAIALSGATPSAPTPDSTTGASDARDATAPPPTLVAARRGGGAARDAAGKEREEGVGTAAPATTRLRGRVVDAEGRPVRGATVRAAGSAAGAPSATTDEAGAFALDVPVGTASVLVAAPGFVEVAVAISALAEGATSELRVTLAAGWTISGTVRDAATAEPIPGAVVRAHPSASPDSPDPRVAETREDGAFVVAVPGPGSYVLEVGRRAVLGAAAAADEYVATRVEPVAAGAADVRVLLAKGLPIEGRVVDEAGEAVARGLTVSVVGRTDAGDPDYTRRKFVRVVGGALLVPGLAPGRYDLWIRPETGADDGTGAPVAATVVRDVEAGTRGLVVRLPHGVVLVGRLEDERGDVVEGKGFVYAYRQADSGRGLPVAGEAPGDGSFRVGPLDDAWRYDLLATAFVGRRNGTVSGVSPRDRGVAIVLAGGGRIAGRIVSDDGKPVPTGVVVGVLAEAAGPRAAGARIFAYSAADGTFVVDGLGDYVFSVEAGGGRSGYLGTLMSGVRPGAADLVLRVSPGVEVSGVLVDADGAPVATTSLTADDGGRVAAMRPYVQVGPDGRFLLRGLRRGRVRLLARRGDDYVDLGEVASPAADLTVKVPGR